MADTILQSNFDVAAEGQTYTFKIPTIGYDVEVAYRAANVRQRVYPEGMGAAGALDWSAINFSRYCAILELYLVSATTLWPWGYADDDMSQVNMSAPPKVDFQKFPLSSSDLVYTVGAAFEGELARFRGRGDTNRSPAGA